MKSAKELEELKNEMAQLQQKLRVLTEEELATVTGGTFKISYQNLTSDVPDFPIFNATTAVYKTHLD